MLIFSLIKLLFSLAIVLFVPGYLVFLALWKNNSQWLGAIEKLVLSFGLSLASVDFLMILLHLLRIPLSRPVLLLAIFLFCLANYLFYRSKKKEPLPEETPDTSFSWKSLLVFLAIFSFALIIRTAYVGQGALPQTTDLGHHMYWAKYITQFQKLPSYEESIITAEDQGKFIIGEHIIFGAIGTISGLDYVSAMPAIILLLINIFSLLALFILSYRLAIILFSKEAAPTMANLTLLVIGVFYAISSPQTSYVSGGVIGNILGNLFLPLMLYAFSQTLVFSAKQPQAAQKMFFLFISFSAALAYTHHLSAFIFLYVFAGFISLFSLLFLIKSRLNFKKYGTTLVCYLKTFFQARNLLLLVIFGVFLYLYPPSYLNPNSINTAVGSPIKETRIGLNIQEISSAAGAWRFDYSVLAILVLCLWFCWGSPTKKPGKNSLTNFCLAVALLVSWFVMIFLMSYRPAWLRVDIPSGRIANYLGLPAALLSSFLVYLILKNSRRYLNRPLFFLVFLVILTAGIISGLANISEAARVEKKTSEAQQVYDAAQYLQAKTAPTEMILKDHINLTADSWIKVFLMRGYLYPLSRSYLHRYEDTTKQRETCTRDMIALPNEETGEQCFASTNTGYVMLKPGLDTAQFEKSPNFSKLFSSNAVVIYKKN